MGNHAFDGRVGVEVAAARVANGVAVAGDFGGRSGLGVQCRKRGTQGLRLRDRRRTHRSSHVYQVVDEVQQLSLRVHGGLRVGAVHAQPVHLLQQLHVRQSGAAGRLDAASQRLERGRAAPRLAQKAGGDRRRAFVRWRRERTPLGVEHSGFRACDARQESDRQG